ncbi:hypothetical protein [Seonamhaeicola sp.]|uniref:hypothetical protein n=1 Tax=Seonamhaeicola sp. TaxID=1912245 RepID=UPI00260E3ADC|nr:hypothetical protein [Seonamhaeicola sp.]
MKTKKIVIRYFIPLVMLFFFVRNIVLVETHDLDSWMGGGMRMFGKIDKMLYRVSGFNVEYNNKGYFVNLRNIKELEDQYVESKILPSESRLQEILEEIKDYNWCYNESTDKITISVNEETCNHPIPSGNIKNIEVYKIQYNAESKEVTLKLINNVKSL